MRKVTFHVQTDFVIKQTNKISMLNKCIIILVLFMSSFPMVMAGNGNTNRTIPFDKAWSFANVELADADQVSFDDSKWRIVNLPHDWSIEDLPNQEPDKVVGPFTKSSIGRAATGWTVGGTGWYRKKFVTDQGFRNKLVSIYFDGVYMNSDVWLNGRHLGSHPYGYTPFYYDLTPYLKPAGQENILAVRVRNEGKTSRWYSGSGIYRNVSLTITDPIHVDTWGVYITTPEVSKNSASVKISTTINSREKSNNTISLVTTLVDPSGKAVGNTKNELQLDGGKSGTVEQTLSLANPMLWSLELPQQYKAITEVKKGDITIDLVETKFGVRSIKFDGTKGFLLNDKAIVLKGGCIHHDNGPLGSAAFERAEERKIEILKKNGYNAIRSSHNPLSQKILEACDRIGMLVLDEAFDTWVRPKNPDDYNLYFNQYWKKDIQAMILRGRNHPSIIMWSIGNEIWEAPDLVGVETARKLIDEVHRLDPTRPVTEAFVYTPPYTQHPLKDYANHASLLDVEGYNYFLEVGQPHFERDTLTTNFLDCRHTNNPNKTVVITESLPLYALENWNKSEQSPWMIGSFKWTAFDYMGEAGLGKSRITRNSRPELKGLIGMGLFFKDEWPIYNSGSGDFDVIGGKKQASYYQDVVWRNSPVEMLVHYPIPEGMKEAVATWGFPDELKSWNWPGQEGKKLQVLVYTRSKLVKLELNGKVIAEQTLPEGSITTTFNIDYQPGTLVAKSYNGVKLTGTNTLKTAGKPVGIRLVADRTTINADLNDLSYVNVEIIDANGNVVPNIDDLEVTYQLTGNATIAAVGNGNVADMSSFQQNHKKVYQGRGLVIVRPNGNPGKITLKASVAGLKDSTIEIDSK
jgi:beta-galactosidase